MMHAYHAEAGGGHDCAVGADDVMLRVPTRDYMLGIVSHGLDLSADQLLFSAKSCNTSYFVKSTRCQPWGVIGVQFEAWTGEVGRGTMA